MAAGAGGGRAAERARCATCGVARLRADECEVRLTAAEARAIVQDVLVLRRATCVAPGQTPMLDRLVNTLVLHVAETTGVQLITEPEPAAPMGRARRCGF